MDEFNHTIEKELTLSTSPSATNLVDHILHHAHNTRASDVHIDPQEHTVRIRFRIDGVLEDSKSIPKKMHGEIISRIKVLSQLRTDEHSTPQDGRFRVAIENKDIIDIRVSIVPTYHGENVVLRLLSNHDEDFTLDSLGFREHDSAHVSRALKNASGMIVVTGPTGSGKTTTLYTLVKMLNSKEISIITIEDPIEYAIQGIKQIQVNPRTGLTFANGLRSILRQDPNIIMVGEIRDTETASIAINTALTGHLLLSTLHTSDAATTLPRLIDMKIEPFLISSTVSIAIGQRLVRKICAQCKQKINLTDQEVKSLQQLISSELLDEHQNFYVGAGCTECHHTGYAGRMIIAEVLVASENIREAVLRKASAREIKQIAIHDGMTPLLVDGFLKAAHGLTTIKEVLRVTQE